MCATIFLDLESFSLFSPHTIGNLAEINLNVIFFFGFRRHKFVNLDVYCQLSIAINVPTIAAV